MHKIKNLINSFKITYDNIINIYTKKLKDKSFTYKMISKYLLEQTLLTILLFVILVIVSIILILSLTNNL